MVMKFHNFDIFYKFCSIFDLSSALSCRIESNKMKGEEVTTTLPRVYIYVLTKDMKVTIVDNGQLLIATQAFSLLTVLIALQLSSSAVNWWRCNHWFGFTTFWKYVLPVKMSSVLIDPHVISLACQAVYPQVYHVKQYTHMQSVRMFGCMKPFK